MSDERDAADAAGTSPPAKDDTTHEPVHDAGEDLEPGTATTPDDAGAGPDGPPDPLDRSVPVASLAAPRSAADPSRTTGGGEESDDPADTPASDLPRTGAPGTWPGPGTGSVPTVTAETDDGSPSDSVQEDDRDHGDAPAGGWRALIDAMRPQANRSQLLAAVLCAALGFALVVQVQQSAQDPLSSARQDDLVRLLDEVTQRSEQLADQVTELSRTRDELQSGTGQAQAAVDLAEERAGSEGILSGRLPAVGPGVEIVVRDSGESVDASKMFNVLEELRNAGAEVVELDGIRLVTSTWFRDTDEGIVVDGQPLDPPYRWTVIGDPSTLSPALEIPGGALATLRTAGAEATIVEHDEVEVTAVREPSEPRYATPQGPQG